MDANNSTIFPEMNLQYASFWERFGASFLDGLVVIAINAFVSYLLEGSFFSEELFGISWFANLAIGWLYYSLQESGKAQATLGKRALNIKVTDTSGGRISFGQATGRHFARYLSMIILFIGYFMMLWDTRKQTLHDKLANTLVVSQDSFRHNA